MSITTNISLPTLRRYLSALGLVQRSAEQRTAESFREQLMIRTPSVNLDVGKLSGGNQQKVMLSKWLNARPKLLILDEPTRGIDVRAKAEVHHIINDLAAEGLGIILISSDLPEVLAMSDRVLVMREGRQMGIFDREEATQERVMTAAMGQHDRIRNSRGSAAMNAIRRRFQPEQIRELVLIALIIGILLFFGTQIENYFSPRTFTRISTSVAVIAVVAVGQTLVILTRNIDLSVGSIVGFTAYVVGTILSINNDIPPVMVVLMAIAMGAVMGSINGLLVAYGRVPAIIVTLGTLAIFRTVLVEISGANSVLTNELPRWLVNLPPVNAFTLGPLDIRLLFFMAVVVVIVFQLVVSYLPWGRRLYAIGSNPDAARVAGFPAQRIIFTAFVLSGALAGLGGFMFLARFGNITVVAGQGVELQSVAAAVVGGVSTNGGCGTPFGALLGAILIDVLDSIA